MNFHLVEQASCLFHPIKDEFSSCGTGILPVPFHGQDARATKDEFSSCGTGILPVPSHKR
ncbi:hypothetical protein QUA16_09240 [Microcoleus sp. S13_C3]